MRRNWAALAAAAAVGLGVGSLTWADEVLFNNGDRLTGKITSAAGGKLTLETAVAGKVTVDLANVKTFSTDAPVEIGLQDGSVLNQRAQAADEPGTIRTEGGAAAPQTLPLATVKDINKPPVAWTGSFVLGGTLTRGNSKSESLNATFDAVRRAEDNRITLNAQYLYGRQRDPDTGDNTTTTDNWQASGKYDQFFTPKFYGFGIVKVERDNIADLDLRLSPSVGVGYQWVERPDLNFNTEAGGGWVYESFENDGAEERAVVRLAYHLDKKLNDTVSAFHNLEYLPGLTDPGDYNLNADAGLRATLTKQMFAEFKVEWKFDSEPAPDAAENDLRYILGVGWRF